MQKLKENKQQDGTYNIMVYDDKYDPFQMSTFIDPSKIDLVKQGELTLYRNSENKYPLLDKFPLHQKVNGVWIPVGIDLDHDNHSKVDNVSENLIPRTHQQNMQNKMRRGYINDAKRFVAYMTCDLTKLPEEEMRKMGLIDRIDQRESRIYSFEYSTEVDVCRVVGLMELTYKKYNPEFNCFDILRYRGDDFRTLFRFRTGVTSKEESLYEHLLTYKNNAWYMLRYNLEDIFKQFSIPLPDYTVDKNGYLIDPKSGAKLCPEKCNTREKRECYSSYYKTLQVKSEIPQSIVTDISNYLELPMRSKIVVDTPTKKIKLPVDTEVLYTEFYNRFVEYKKMGYTTRASLNLTKKEYQEDVKETQLQSLIDRVLDNTATIPSSSMHTSQEEERALLSFFQTFCDIEFDTDQFLAEFNQIIISKEKFGYCKKAAIVTTIDDYIRTFGLCKVTLFIKYYYNKQATLIYKDFYNDILCIENLWKNIFIYIQDFESCIFIDCDTGKKYRLSRNGLYFVDMLDNEIIDKRNRPLTLEDCINSNEFKQYSCLDTKCLHRLEGYVNRNKN